MCKPQTLDDYITLSGKKKSYLAKLLDMSPRTFKRKRSDPRKFTASEYLILCKELGISDFEESTKIFCVES